MITKLNLTLKLPEDFSPAETYPNRGPIALAEALRPFVENKVFCDLGCGAGDIVELLTPYAKKTYGIEFLEKRAYKRPIRNFELLVGDIWELMPEADVYYNWVTVAMAKKMAEFFHDKNKTLIVGGVKDANHIHYMIDQYKADVYEFTHNEICDKQWDTVNKSWDVPWWIAVIK